MVNPTQRRYNSAKHTLKRLTRPAMGTKSNGMSINRKYRPKVRITQIFVQGRFELTRKNKREQLFAQCEKKIAYMRYAKHAVVTRKTPIPLKNWRRISICTQLNCHHVQSATFIATPPPSSNNHNRTACSYINNIRVCLCLTVHFPSLSKTTCPIPINPIQY